VKRASRITSAVLGLFAGGASIEHGIYEILQGNVQPAGLFISSMGPPCQPETVWHACEPAITIIPSFLVSGILAVLIGVFVMVWSLAFIQKMYGGLIVIAASILMLLFGGGIFPPLIGMVGGAVGRRVRRGSVVRPVRPFWRFLGRLWPWTLIVLSAWLLSQWLIGYLFNDFLLKSGFLIPGLVVGLLALSVLATVGHDRSHGRRD
jgi:hypothetical protein